MPRVIKRTPEWLVQPSPGYDAFAAKPKPPSAVNGTSKHNHTTGPLRTIAKGRGTEVFVASGNELRWTDLRSLKADYEGSDGAATDPERRTGWRYGTQSHGAYRVLRIPGHGQIRQLVVSPEHDFLAIVRSHTIHIALLPDSRNLNEHEFGPLKVKTFQLGPTSHVLEESPITSVMWHPLGQFGRCLVTITADAVVRLWEINHEDRSSFDEPSISLDLKKLANATSAEQDLRASTYGSSRGFTPDSVELEPAAACFGGKGEEGEYPWRAMTLWIAMKEGDVYALCPLLPKRFQAFPGLINSLSLLINAEAANEEGAQPNVLTTDAQARWLEEIEEQEPFAASDSSGFSTTHVYSRPQNPGPTPKLQGPFELEPELDESLEIADILVTGLDVGARLSNSSDEYDLELDELQMSSASVICLLTRSGSVHICLNLDGLGARWLPSGTTPFSTPKKQLSRSEGYPTLIVFETVNISPLRSALCSLSITPDVCSPYAFFVTNSDGVHYVSMASWIRGIHKELEDPADAGTAFRADVFLEGASSLVEHPIVYTKATSDTEVVSCVAFADHHAGHTSLGYLVLTSIAGQPWATQLDIADSDLYLVTESTSRTDQEDNRNKQLILSEPREAYRPDQRLDVPSVFPQFIHNIPQRQRHALKEEVKLDPATLQMLVDAHRILSHETHRLNDAAADLFRQCKRLQNEFKDQIKRACEVKERVDAITGNDDDTSIDEQRLIGAARLEQRFETTVARQRDLIERHERLKKKLAKVFTRDLSDKEKAWIAEVDRLDRSVPDNGEAKEDALLLRRLSEVKSLGKELVQQARESHEAKVTGSHPQSTVTVPEHFRKQRVAGVLDLLERESALVDAATARLNRLGANG